MEQEKHIEEENNGTPAPGAGPDPRAAQAARDRAAAITNASSQILANAMSADSVSFVAAYEQTGGQ